MCSFAEITLEPLAMEFVSKIDLWKTFKSSFRCLIDPISRKFDNLLIIHCCRFSWFRENFVYLQVGYKAFRYEYFRQKAQYDSGALLGESKVIIFLPADSVPPIANRRFFLQLVLSNRVN